LEAMVHVCCAMAPRCCLARFAFSTLLNSAYKQLTKPAQRKELGT
jgi:hypothetical protein